MFRTFGLVSLLCSLLILTACASTAQNGVAEPEMTSTEKTDVAAPAPPEQTADKTGATAPSQASQASRFEVLARKSASGDAEALKELDTLRTETLNSGDDQKIGDMVSEIAALLEADVTAQVKIILMQQLGAVDRDEAVDALAAMLASADESLWKAAVLALKDNPAQAARIALETALANETVAVKKLVLMNSVAARGDKASLQILTQAAQSDDVALAEAAVLAISSFDDPRARFSLFRVWRNQKAAARTAAEAALLKMADKELETDNKATAGRLYQDLYQHCLSDATYFAALRGMAKCEGPRILVLLIEMMKSEDQVASEKAAEIALEIPGEVVTLTLSMIMNELPDYAQAVIIEGLSKRGDASARTAALNGLDHSDQRVRTASLQTLAAAGDDQDLPLIAKTALEGKADEREVAVDGLAQWRSPKALDVMLATVKASDSQTHRVKLLEGYLRLAKETSFNEPEKLTRLIEQGMAAADSVLEKKVVLESLNDLRTIDALMLLELYLSDQNLRRGAARTMLIKAEELAPEHKEAALAAIGKVRAAVDDEDILKRADLVEAEIKAAE